MSGPTIQPGETTDPQTPEYGFWLFGRVIISYLFLSTEGYFEEFIYDYSSNVTVASELDGVSHHCLESTLNFTRTRLNESILAGHQVPWYLGKTPIQWSKKDGLDSSYIKDFILNIITTRVVEYIAALLWIYILFSASHHMYRWYDRWFYRNRTLPYAAKNLHLSKWVLRKHGFVVFPLRPHEVIEELADDVTYGPLPPPYPVVNGYDIVDGKYVRVQPTTKTEPTSHSKPQPQPLQSLPSEMKFSPSGFYGREVKELEEPPTNTNAHSDIP